MLDEAPKYSTFLRVDSLNAFYGESHVLHNVSFAIRQGEVVTLLGRNGAGKTTTLKAIMGMLDRTRGSIIFKDRELNGMRSYEIGRLGIAYCPEERGILASLNVEENLMLPPVIASGGLSLDEVHDLFPNLRERRRAPGNRLSGGEQQMLAIARILRTGSRVLLLDEPTEGLAPTIVQQIGAALRRLKEANFTILLVEQNLGFASSIADRHYVLENGAIADMLDREGLHTASERLERYLGI